MFADAELGVMRGMGEKVESSKSISVSSGWRLWDLFVPPGRKNDFVWHVG